jgi:hypothetical protein
MATRTKVTSVLSLCSSKWLLGFFVLLGFTQVFSQEVTFKVKKDTLVEKPDTTLLIIKKTIDFNFNDSITTGMLSKQYILKNGLKLTASIKDVHIYGFELRCENKNGLYKNFVIHGDKIPFKVLRQLNKMPTGSTILVGAIRASSPKTWNNTFTFMTLRLTD